MNCLDELAEEEGFEPPIPFRVRQFSRLEPSTTRPLFLTSSLVRARWQRKRRKRVPQGHFFLISPANRPALSRFRPYTALAASPPYRNRFQDFGPSGSSESLRRRVG